MINVAKVEVLVAALMGIMMVFLFSSWAIKAVGVTAQSVIREVRRQLADDPGIMTYSSRPEYGKCVSIVTEAALGQMIKPALLALLMPIAIPVFFRLVSGDDDPRRLAAEALGAFLICSAMAGLLLATAFDNGPWPTFQRARFLMRGFACRGPFASRTIIPILLFLGVFRFPPPLQAAGRGTTRRS